MVSASDNYQQYHDNLKAKIEAGVLPENDMQSAKDELKRIAPKTKSLSMLEGKFSELKANTIRK